MRGIINKQLPDFSTMVNKDKFLDDFESKMSYEAVIIKPSSMKPRPVPQISFSMFASPEEQKDLKDSESQISDEPVILKPAGIISRPVPHVSFSMFASHEAQKALKYIHGKSDDESEQDENNDVKDDKEESGEMSDETSEKPPTGKMESGIRARYQWGVVAKAVTGDPSLGLGGIGKKRGRRASIAVMSGAPSLTPVPPNYQRQRRMSLSPARHPLPNRHQATAPVFRRTVQKTSSDSNLTCQSKLSPAEDDKSTSRRFSSPPKIEVTGGNPMLARALSRRRFSLPVTSTTHLIPLRPPEQSQLRSSSSERGSAANSTGTASQTPSMLSTSSHGSGSSGASNRFSTTNTLQANRAMLESLMKERSKVVANLTVGGNRESPAGSPSISIRSKHSLPRPMLSRGSPDIPDSSPGTSTPELSPVVRSLDDEPTVQAVSEKEEEEEARDDAHDDSMSVKSGTTTLTTRSLNDLHRCRAITQQRPVFSRRGSWSVDSSLSSGSMSMASEPVIDFSASSSGDIDNAPATMSRLRRRRGTICVGSLNAFMISKPDETEMAQQGAIESAKEHRRRSENDIENEVEEELQRRIVKRKSQLSIQAAPGSNNQWSAVSRLESRANSKTTNGRLRKIMDILTTERTTAELLTMKSAEISYKMQPTLEDMRMAKSLDHEH